MSVQLSRQRSRRSGGTVGARMAVRLRGMLQYDTAFWRWAAAGLFVCSGAALGVCARGIPSGFGYWFDAAALILSCSLAMAISGIAVAAALSLAMPRTSMPRFFIGCLLYLLGEGLFIVNYLEVDPWTSLALAALFTLASLVPALLAGYFAGARVRIPVKAGAAIGLTALTLAAVYWPPPGNVPVDIPVTATAAAEDIAAPDVGDPSTKGPFLVKSFTYGSGSDPHRPEFAGQAELRTKSVDASGLISRWLPLRTAFWGFDQTSLPLNGRVWMPEQAGTYPLVLMVHGNHLMEDFSDDGYAYLGELLASRGFVFVSADENFLNDSVWSGSPDNDMKARAWLLLHHLAQLAVWSRQEDNPFAGTIDLERVALAGHSRGGQAAAMASDMTRWIRGSELPSGLKGVSIKAVAAVAPTDKPVDGKSAVLKDVDYFTLHGARDSDVDHFYGDRQYIRTSFTPGSGRFKASLYIGGANHSRFNSDWGLYDHAMPIGLFLNTEAMLAAEESRQIVKVFLSAFLERSLHGDAGYEPLLRDYRTGKRYLPDTGFWNRYESADMVRIADFDGGGERTRLAPGVKADARGMYEWAVAEATDRSRQKKGTKGLVLAWRQDAVFTLTFTEPPWKAENGSEAGQGGTLSFSLANLDRDLTPADGSRVPLPAITVETVDRDGRTASLPLAAFMSIEPLPKVQYTVSSYLEKRLSNGRYKEPVEPVFQTYLLPLTRFREAAPDFAPSRLERVTLRIADGPGKIMLDDIGWYP